MRRENRRRRVYHPRTQIACAPVPSRLSGRGPEPIAGPYPPSPRTPIRGPSLNVEAHPAGCYRTDALGSAPFAPLRQVERAGDGPRIGVLPDAHISARSRGIACPQPVTPAPEPGSSLGSRGSLGGSACSPPAAAASGVRDGPRLGGRGDEWGRSAARLARQARRRQTELRCVNPVGSGSGATI